MPCPERINFSTLCLAFLSKSHVEAAAVPIPILPTGKHSIKWGDWIMAVMALHCLYSVTFDGDRFMLSPGS